MPRSDSSSWGCAGPGLHLPSPLPAASQGLCDQVPANRHGGCHQGPAAGYLQGEAAEAEVHPVGEGGGGGSEAALGGVRRQAGGGRRVLPLPWRGVRGVKDFTCQLGEPLAAWLLQCWDMGARGLALEGREARQLGSLTRDHPISRESRRGATAHSLCRQLLQGAKENHRLTECCGLEGTFRGHLIQPPCHGQVHLPLDQVAQVLVQPDLECFKGWGIHHLSGQPVPGFHHPHCKKCLTSSLNLPSFSLKPLPSSYHSRPC